MLDSYKSLDRIRLNNLTDKELNECCDAIENDLKKVEIVNRLESGKTIIYHGKFIGLSRKGYEKYKGMIKEKFYEPHTMVVLKAENEKIKSQLKTWLKLLESSDCNSKCMVVNDIEKLLEELDNEM